MRVRPVVAISLFATSMAVIVAFGVSGAGTTAPEAATEVPASIPVNGVNINTQVVLLPPSSGDVATIDPFQAIDATSAHMDKTLDSSALLARVTVPGTIPPSDSPVPFRAIEDRLAWVVTFTLDRPEDANLGKPQAGPLWVTHYSAVLDADSGEFLTGFFTA